jgi:hypothetical protein
MEFSCSLVLTVVFRMPSFCRNPLKLANDKGLKAVAFPAISCGVYGYPIPDAAKARMTPLGIGEDA